jgi:hypothetical protein
MKRIWENWVGNPYREEKGSFIDHNKLREVAEAMDHLEKEKVEEIAIMLEHGADLGIKGEGRWPSVGKNNTSVYTFGQRVADSLQTGVKDGILYGPLRREELPWEPKVSPMTVRLKPNGSARIIIDLSHPHGPKLGEGRLALQMLVWKSMRSSSLAPWRGMWHGGNVCIGLAGHVRCVRRTGTWPTSMSQSGLRTTDSKSLSLVGGSLWRDV